jgi:hypothetical protein
MGVLRGKFPVTRRHLDNLRLSLRGAKQDVLISHSGSISCVFDT